MISKKIMLAVLLSVALAVGTTVGQAADTDTLVASANAYLSALNKMIIKREKTAPAMEQEKEKVRGI